MFWWRDDQDDVEAAALQDFLKSVRTQFGTNIVLHLDLHSDLCPHPDAWWSTEPGVEYRAGAPIYGMIWGANQEQLRIGTNFAVRLDSTPRLGAYLRGPAEWLQSSSLPEGSYASNVGAAIHIEIEFDEACLYRDDTPFAPVRPQWLMDPPEPFRRCAGTNCFWVDGPIDHQEYYHFFGEDIADAIEAHFCLASTPQISRLGSNSIQVRWERGILQQAAELQGEGTVWTDVIGAVSPWNCALGSGDVMFFRTKRPND